MCSPSRENIENSLRALAAEIVERLGTDYEYLSLAEMTWDRLEELGLRPGTLSGQQLDYFCNKVDLHCKEIINA